MSNDADSGLLADSSAPPPCGTVVLGKYRILRPLGEGGMGTVFEGENTVTLQRVALKWLHPRLANHQQAQQRLLREARAMARIRHRNVVDLFDALVDGESVILVMELLVGQLLSDRLAAGPMLIRELVALLCLACEGLSAAHAVGVVHRDIKPENIFLARLSDGQVAPKVIDFGISKTAGTDVRLTHSGMVLGTPRYVSFEQLRGDEDLDGRSDVYSLGVILYEGLIGRAPYDSRSLGEQAIQFMVGTPPSPHRYRPELPAGLVDVATRALKRDRDERFATVDHLREALASYATAAAYPSELPVWWRSTVAPPGGADAEAETRPNASGSTPPPNEPRISLPAMSRQRWLCGALGALLVLAGLVVASTLQRPQVTPTPPKNIVGTVSPSAAPLAAVDAPPLRHDDIFSPPETDAQIAPADPARAEPVTKPPPRRVSRASRAARAHAPVPNLEQSAPAVENVPPAPAANTQVHRAGPLLHDEF